MAQFKTQADFEQILSDVLISLLSWIWKTASREVEKAFYGCNIGSCSLLINVLFVFTHDQKVCG